MAKFQCEIPTDFMSDLLDSDFEEIAKEALEECTPLLEKSVKDSARSVIKDNTRTELVNSFKPWKTGIKNVDDGYIMGVAVYGKPSKGGKRKSGTGKRNLTNNDIAWWLEHGNSHQAAKPYLDRAAKAVETAVIKQTQEIYNKKVGAE